MRHVYPTREIPHLWAHQTQETARNPQNNLYFNGPVIFSYRDSFPIARIFQKKGESIVLCTTDRYSVTTGGHINLVLRAVSNLKVFHVPNVGFHYQQRGPLHKESLKDYQDRIKQLTIRASRAKSNKPWIVSSLLDLIKEANQYSHYFGLKTKFKELDKAQVKSELIKLKEESRKKAAENKEIAAKRNAEAQERLRLWRLGENTSIYGLKEVALRIVGDDIQTSLGARVPLKHALQIVPFLLRGLSYKHNGHSIHLGPFRIDEITEDGNLKAGCHKIKKDEMLRLYNSLTEEQRSL